MFRPSAPTSLSLANSFTLGYVTASSSAAGFTPTMASSEGPLSVTATLLCRLGLGCRSYNGPDQTARHRVRSCTFLARSPPLPNRITERILGFDNRGYLARSVRPTRGSHRVLSSKFSVGFLQIPHWLPFTGLSLLRQIREVSSGTLAFAYIFPPFKGYGWTYTS
jgi:hypothetical protein